VGPVGKNTPEKNAQVLSKITNWPVDDINLAVGQLGLGKEFSYTMNGIFMLQTIFECSEKLGVSVNTVLDIKKLPKNAVPPPALPGPALYDACKRLSKLIPKNADKSDAETVKVEKKRDMTILLVKKYLNEHLPEDNKILTDRDLYEYLLIDVKSSGAVKTSKFEKGTN